MSGATASGAGSSVGYLWIPAVDLPAAAAFCRDVSGWEVDEPGQGASAVGFRAPTAAPPPRAGRREVAGRSGRARLVGRG